MKHGGGCAPLDIAAAVTQGRGVLLLSPTTLFDALGGHAALTPVG